MYSKEHKEVIAKCINSFGSGDHPVACPDTAEHFAAAYAVECLCKALEFEQDKKKSIEETAEVFINQLEAGYKEPPKGEGKPQRLPPEPPKPPYREV